MADAFRDRLRHLRREQPSAPSADLPAWLRARLERSKAVAPRDPRGATRSLGPPRDLREIEGPRGTYAVRDTWFEHDARHGAHALEAARRAPGQAFALLTRGLAPADLDVERAVFLDIETTGLSGGAGTHTYMVGLGGFEPGGFRVRQAFLRGPEEERALLAGCAECIAASSGLVSFFGKSFDRHRLQDKMRVHGVPPPFEGLAHLDLYWPCRRLYGAATPDTRLNTMERLLCGVERDHDLPGSFAPAAWFDFLAGRAHLLEDVFTHNLDDVLSLVTLLDHVAHAPLERDATGPELAAARALALARLHLDARRWSEALDWIERALERCTDMPTRRDLCLKRALVWARGEQPARALAELRELAREGRDAVASRACLEAARLGWRLERDAARSAREARRAEDLIEVTLSGRERARLVERARALRARCEAAS